MSMQGKNRKPLRCKLGLHQWSRDAAMYSSADVCNCCGQYADDEAAQRLELERELWGEAKSVLQDPDQEEQSRYVRAFLFGFFIEDYAPRPVWTQHEAELRAFRSERIRNAE